ncbi:MAG: DNA primase [Nevskiaceae bacterium]|nr:MAG: DNA primase [Nevskiaceae bacterium]TAM21823.1 MAG: DNA primase [Nevskiaceae bacterium]
MTGRIPDSFIQDLLARSDIVEIIGTRVELKRAGKELKGLSPFTHEKSPSFFVSPTKQMFFDFSSGKNGNAIGFLMEYDRLSFVEAVEELAGRLGLEIPREGGFSQRLVLDGPLDALAAAERYWRDQLKHAPAAVAYLKKRGVNGETAKTFGLGYAPESWDALTKLFPDPKHALEAGLLIEREGREGAYDRFRNRIMFPIRDTRGRVIGFGGRTLGNDPAKYLNSPETPLFHKGRNLYGLYEAKQAAKSALPYLIVVEGYMDVVMLAQHGVREAVATLGTATTAEHLHLLFKQTNKVVFSFDGDRAGRSAAWRALEQALPEVYGVRECRFLFLPEGHDPDSLVQEIGAEAFRALVDGALPLTAFLLSELEKQVDLNSLEGRAKLAALAQPHLAKLKEGPLRSLLGEELARRTRLSAAQIERLAAPATHAATEPAPANRPTGGRSDPAARLPRRALRILLEAPALASQAQHLEQLAASPAPGAVALAEAIEFFQEHPDYKASQLLQSWQGTPKGMALARLAAEPLDIDGAALGNEFRESLRRLRERAVRAEMEKLVGHGRSLSLAEQQELIGLQHQLSELKTV